MRGAVAHGEYVVVAGDVAAAGEVIGALGEAGCHSIGSLQDAHSRFYRDCLGNKEGGKREERCVRNTEDEEKQTLVMCNTDNFLFDTIHDTVYKSLM